MLIAVAVLAPATADAEIGVSAVPFMLGSATHIPAPGDTTSASAMSGEVELHFQKWSYVKSSERPMSDLLFSSFYYRLQKNNYKGDDWREDRFGFRMGFSTSPIAKDAFHVRAFADVSTRGLSGGLTAKAFGLLYFSLDGVSESLNGGIIIPLPVE